MRAPRPHDLTRAPLKPDHLPCFKLVPCSRGTGRMFIMGEVIRKDAAADDIAADGNTTLTNAAARGGAWKPIAEERLGPAVALFNKVVADLNQAESALAPLQAAVAAYDGEADDFLGAKSDEMWNLVGRPAFDAAYSLAWPGGASAYTDGPDDEQPERMELLAEILMANLHPKIDPAGETVGPGRPAGSPPWERVRSGSQCR